MIPITVIDDFFENPDMVVNLANSLTYKSDEEKRWPGKRSDFLHIVAPDFFDIFCKKMFAVYYDINDPNIRCNVKMNFQKIDSSYKEGWVHQDSDCLITSIVYLNRNINYKSGTSIMAKKTLIPKHPEVQQQLDFLNQESEETYIAMKNTNEQYRECVSIKNKYNRFIAFPANLYHKAQDFENAEERLTLVTFVEKLYAPKSFLTEMRKIII